MEPIKKIICDVCGKIFSATSEDQKVCETCSTKKNNAPDVSVYEPTFEDGSEEDDFNEDPDYEMDETLDDDEYAFELDLDDDLLDDDDEW